MARPSLHQYEEYVDPGWFPGHFNKGLFGCDSPRDYPLNTNSGLCVNIAPILFPRHKVLGLAPVVFGWARPSATA